MGKMTDADKQKALNGFFRFYEDGFEQTEPFYQSIVGSMIKSGKLDGKSFDITTTDSSGKQITSKITIEKGTMYQDGIEIKDDKKALEVVIARCRELDEQEVENTGGNVSENKIGLQGFFTSLGFDKDLYGDRAKKLTEEAKKKDPDAKTIDNEDALKADFMDMGQAALDSLPKEFDGMPIPLTPKQVGELSPEKQEEYRQHLTARAFLGQLAAGPYFPRTTCTSASYLMSLGRIMQIGCSQGKTSVVAMTTYIQLMMGKKVYSTSSSPGLVPENYDEARDFYTLMGIEDQFCAISQNTDDKTDHIVLFHGGIKYEVRADGQIYAEKEIKGKTKMVPLTKDEISQGNLIQELGIAKDPNDTDPTKYDFEATIKSMMESKGIIMGDTMTLGKYQYLMPGERDNTGVIKGSYLIVDEADAELLDTNPQEITGRAYEGEEAQKRQAQRAYAKEVMEKWDKSTTLEEFVAQAMTAAAKEGKELPLDFLLDAHEAQEEYADPDQYTVKFEKAKDKDGNEYRVAKIFVLNPNTNVMVAASQGLSQAILARNPGLIPEKTTEEKEETKPDGTKETVETTYDVICEELEVLGETDIPKLFSNFETASLMSGTMQDKGLSEMDDSEHSKAIRTNYQNARKAFLQLCGRGLRKSLMESGKDGVIDWKLVTPKTRKERGDVVVTMKGMQRGKGIDPDHPDVEIKTAEDTPDFDDWEVYLKNKGQDLEKNWRKAVQEEAKKRSDDGQPVMVSVYGGRNPMVTENGDPLYEVYTDKHQIGGQHIDGGDKYLFSDLTGNFKKDEKGNVLEDENGDPIPEYRGEIACFDDFYGRGYTFKFVTRDKNGDVIKKPNAKGKMKPVKQQEGGHVLITSLPQNSRNLEQFLFRVARGGDKGSSSMIISPTDPVLLEYLHRLQEETNKQGQDGKAAANQYLKEVLSGKKKVIDIVTDIYPEKTADLFYKKAGLVKTQRKYDDLLKNKTDGLVAVFTNGEKGKTIEDLSQKDQKFVQKYELLYHKEVIKRMKLYRKKGAPEKVNDEEIAIKVLKTILKSKELSTEQIIALIPPDISKEQLESLIPDQQTREAVIASNGRINDALERETPDTQKSGRTGEETLDATHNDMDYNLTETEKALVTIRNRAKAKEKESASQDLEDQDK